MIARALRRRGVLGMNGRNARYVGPWNPRRLFPRVDDKLRAKRVLDQAGVPVPEEIGVIRYLPDLRRLASLVEGESGFVMKPAHGAGGSGILVVRERGGQRLVRRRKPDFDLDRIRFHATEILSGLYSLGGQPDVVLIEELLEPAPELARMCGTGVPDLRLVVFRGVPAMAMLRLPTTGSGGRANLHQGAVGVGVDLATGRTTSAVRSRRRIARHPDTDVVLAGLALPDFDGCLVHATQAAQAIGLGYVGVDIVLDARRGALVLEVNARPGLSIQLANRSGLDRTLGRIGAALGEREAAPAVAEAVSLGRAVARELSS